MKNVKAAAEGVIVGEKTMDMFSDATMDGPA